MRRATRRWSATGSSRGEGGRSGLVSAGESGRDMAAVLVFPSIRRALGAVGAAILVLSAACGDPDAAGGSPAAAPELPTWSVAQELRIGSVDDPEQALTPTNPNLLAVSPDGDIYIGQPQSGEIRSYDSTGRLARTIGGRGRGPGEFTRMASIGIVGQLLYAVNLIPARVEIFSLAGEHLRTRTYRAVLTEHALPTPPYVLFPDGTGIVSPTRDSDLADTIVYLRIDSLETVLDTILAFPRARVRVSVPLERGHASIRQPFGGVPPFAVSADGGTIWTAETERSPAQATTYRVTKRTAARGTIYSRVYPYSPVELPPAVRDSAFDAVLAAVRRWHPDGGEAPQIAREFVSVPTHYRAVLGMRADADGSVWLHRPPVPGSEFERWEMHGPDGAPRAHVLLPRGLQVALFRRGRVWGIEHDEFDVPYVVRYRIRPGRSPR